MTKGKCGKKLNLVNRNLKFCLIAIRNRDFDKTPRIGNNMKLKTLFTLFFPCALFILSTFAFGDQNGDLRTRKVVVFARNDSADKALDTKAKPLELAVCAKLNELGLSAIDYDMAIRSLNDYLSNPNAKYLSDAEKLKASLEENVGAAIFAGASGQRAAELLGADYILSVSISSLGKSEKKFSGYGINTVNTLYTLRSSYSLLSANNAAGTSGGLVDCTLTMRKTDNLSETTDDIIGKLVFDTAEKVAMKLKQAQESGRISSNADAESGDVEILFSIEQMSFPEVVQNENGQYVLGSNIIPVEISNVSAYIDGVQVPMGGKMKLSKGFHSLKLSHPDLESHISSIYVAADSKQTLTIPLALTNAARQRWKDNLTFLESIKERAKASDDNRTITNAEAERLKGIAETFRNSGYKIDVKASEIPQINRVQSIFAQ